MLYFGLKKKNSFNNPKTISIRTGVEHLLLIYVVLFFVVFLLGFLMKNISPQVESLLYLFQSILFLLVSWKLLGSELLGIVVLKNKSFKTDLILSLKFFFIYLCVSKLLDFSGIAPPYIFNKSPKLLELQFINQPLIFSLSFFTTCCLAPISEEIFFKRILYISFRQNISFIKAFTFSVLIFSLMHFPCFVTTLLWSLFSYYLYEKYKDLYVNIYFHLFTNLWVIGFNLYTTIK